MDGPLTAKTAEAPGAPKPPEGPTVIQYPTDGPRHVKSRGMRFPNDSRFLPTNLQRSLRSGTYCERTLAAVKAMVKREDVVLELGTGIGFISTFMARKLKVREVQSFEPNPHLIPYIEEVYRENGIENAQVHNALLGKRKGHAKFYVRDTALTSSLEENPKGEGAPVREVLDVEVRNFNTTLREIKPTVLICDIEGAEAALLPGTALNRLRAAIIELHPQWIGQSGVQAVFDAMQAAGLTYFPRQSNGKIVAFKKGW